MNSRPSPLLLPLLPQKYTLPSLLKGRARIQNRRIIEWEGCRVLGFIGLIDIFAGSSTLDTNGKSLPSAIHPTPDLRGFLWFVNIASFGRSELPPLAVLTPPAETPQVVASPRHPSLNFGNPAGAQGIAGGVEYFYFLSL